MNTAFEKYKKLEQILDEAEFERKQKERAEKYD